MDFYRLDFDDENYEYAEEISDSNERVGWCPIYGKVHAPILRKREDVILTIDLPSPNIPDILNTWNSTWIITDETVQLFKSQGFTGYELKPVIINTIKRMRKPREIPKLWHFVTTGFAGMAYPSSYIKALDIGGCDFCNKIAFSYCPNKSASLVDTSQWDGSDFFFIYPVPRLTFITQRVKDFIEENRLTGCKFNTLDEISISYLTQPLDGEEETGIGFHGSCLDLLLLPLPKEKAKAFGKKYGIWQEPEELFKRAIQMDDNQPWWPSKEQWREFIKKAEIKERPKILAEFQNVLKKYGSPSSSIKLSDQRQKEILEIISEFGNKS
ncbi:MAG: hypothetical protein AB1630_08715 [bacterium]